MASEQQWRARVWQRRRWLALIVCAIVAIVALSAGYVLTARQPVRALSVHVDGQDMPVLPGHARTVGQALAGAGITIGPLDRVSPPLTSTLSSSLVITIVRVQTAETVRRVDIPFVRLTSDDAQRARGYRQIVQAGVTGSKEIRETVTTEDGVEVARRVLSEQVVLEAVPERVVVGTRSDPALDAFRDSALGYLRRGGITRLTPAIVEQTVFELARLRGDRYGSVRVLAMNGRPWLVLDAFARSANDVVLLVFWWTDELHAYGQVLSEGQYLLDVRAMQTGAAIELGLITSPGQGSDALAPQYTLHRLPLLPQPGDTWGAVWTSQGNAAWRSSQGAVSFSGDGLERIA